jgi:hypothetical protein
MKAQFLPEWNASQMKQVKKAVCKFINSRYWETLHSPNTDPFIIDQAKTFDKIDSILGLAYTSSSAYAGLFVCNTELYLDNDHKWHLQAFALDSNGFVHAIFWDVNENEIAFNI